MKSIQDYKQAASLAKALISHIQERYRDSDWRHARIMEIQEIQAGFDSNSSKLDDLRLFARRNKIYF